MSFFINIIKKLFFKSKPKMIKRPINKLQNIENTDKRNDFIAELRNSANLEIDDKSRLWDYEHKNRGYDIDI